MRIPGDIGTVVEDDGSSKPFRVKASSGSTWWYTAAAIEKAGDGSGSAAAASGAYEDTDAWWGAVAQGYDPTKLRTMRAACRNDCLDLFNKDIGDDGARILGAALAAMPRPLPYTSIILSYNGLTDAGMEAIAQGMRAGCSRLGRLNCQQNMIGDAGFVAVAAALSVSTNLRALEFDSNQCGDTGMVALAAALSQHCLGFQEINFYGNRVGAAGFKAFAEAIPKLPKFEKAICYSNPGPADDFALAIIKRIKTNAAFKSGGRVLSRDIGLSGSVRKQLRAAYKASGNTSFDDT